MPDTGLALIGQLFDPKRLHPINGGSVTVKESGKQATLKELKIVGVGANAVALCFDKAGHGTPFADGQKVRRACDAILFCRFGDEGYILCFELKSGEPSPEEYAVQLLSGQCFVDYVVSIIKHFHNFDCTKWHRRFFVFHDKKNSISKDTGKPRYSNQSPLSPRIYSVNNGEKIYLRKLLGQAL